MRPIAQRGAIVFSCFIADTEAYISNNHYPHASVPTYHYAFITKSLIQDYAQRNDLQYEITNTFYSLGERNGAEVVHRFVKLTAKS